MSARQPLLVALLVGIVSLAVVHYADGICANIPSPAAGTHGSLLLTSFSASSVIISTTIQPTGTTWTNTDDFDTTISWDITYTSPTMVVTTETIETDTSTYAKVTNADVSFTVDASQILLTPQYMSLCTQCKGTGTVGCSCGNLVPYRLRSVCVDETAVPTGTFASLVEAGENLNLGNGLSTSKLVFTRSTDPADLFEQSTNYLTVPLTSIDAEYDPLYCCVAAGSLPASITSDAENEEVRQDHAKKSRPLLDIVYNDSYLMWRTADIKFATCSDLACSSPVSFLGRYINFNTADTDLPLAMTQGSGKWRGGEAIDSCLCRIGSTSVSTTVSRTVLIDAFSTTTTTSVTTTQTTTVTNPSTTSTAPTTTASTSPSTTTQISTASTTTASTSPSTTTQTSTASTTAPTTTTHTPTTTTANSSTTTTTSVPATLVLSQFRVQITLASQVHDQVGIADVLATMLLDSMMGGDGNLSDHNPAVTVTRVEPGSTVVTATAVNASVDDMSRLRASVEAGTSELVRVYGAIASTLRIDELFPDQPVLAAVATIILLITLAMCTIGCAVGCILYARRSIRRRNEARAAALKRKRFSTTAMNPASDVFSIKDGQLLKMGDALQEAPEGRADDDTHTLDIDGSDLPPITGPLDNVEEVANKKERVDSANLLWNTADQDLSPRKGQRVCVINV